MRPRPSLQSSHKADQNVTQSTPRFSRKWLATLDKERLIDLIMMLSERVTQDTGLLDNQEALDEIERREIQVHEQLNESKIEFIRLPKDTRNIDENGQSWKLQLISHRPGHRPLFIEIVDDIFVGRSAGGIAPDLDTARYDGEQLGVSRHHAMLRPTMRGLVLVDLGSTNGTYHNRRRMSPGSSILIKDGDIITFGHLEFTLKLYQ